TEIMNSTPDRQNRAAAPRKRGRHALAIIALCMVCAAGYLFSQTGTKTQKKGESKQGKGPAAVPVAVAKVTRGSISEFINALGAVTPLRTISITSRVAGELVDVDYSEG